MVDLESGDVDWVTVIQVLRFHGVEVSDCSDGFVLLVKGTTVTTAAVSEWVGKKYLQHLKRTFDVPIHHFFRPEMMDYESISKARGSVQ